jgi:hypothetical protein
MADLGPARSMAQGYNTRRLRSLRFVHRPEPTRVDRMSTPEAEHPSPSRPALPLQQFHVLLTLFSKCFSSFDHSTCSLSVSSRYLALDEIYHPFRAAFPNNSTRRRSFTWIRRGPTGFSPSVTPCSKGLGLCVLRSFLCKLQFAEAISNLSCCRFTRRY